jgi:hypothetical protein
MLVWKQRDNYKSRTNEYTNDDDYDNDNDNNNNNNSISLLLLCWQNTLMSITESGEGQNKYIT